MTYVIIKTTSNSDRWANILTRPIIASSRLYTLKQLEHMCIIHTIIIQYIAYASHLAQVCYMMRPGSSFTQHHRSRFDFRVYIKTLWSSNSLIYRLIDQQCLWHLIPVVTFARHTPNQLAVKWWTQLKAWWSSLLCWSTNLACRQFLWLSTLCKSSDSIIE